MKYVSLFREFGIDIEVKNHPYGISSIYSSSKSSKEVFVFNHTSRDILVAYRDGRTIKVGATKNDSDKGSYYDMNEKLPPGIYIFENLGMPGFNYERIVSEELRRASATAANRAIGTGMVVNGDPFIPGSEGIGKQYREYKKWMNFYSRRVMLEEDLIKMPIAFYDRDTDLSFCMDATLISRFAHPYSEYGSALSLGLPNIADNAIGDRINCFTFVLEYVDNDFTHKGFWLRPFDTREVYYVKAIRNTNLKDGFRMYLTKNITPNGDISDTPTTEILNREEFEKKYPHLRLFEKYEDAIHFDDQSELTVCRQKLRKLEQTNAESTVSHDNTMARLAAERGVIDDKMAGLEEAARLRREEHAESLRRKDEVHQQDIRQRNQEHDIKLRQLQDENDRQRRQIEDLHRQKKEHRESEHAQDQRLAEAKAKHDEKIAKRKTFWELVKAVPAMFSTAVSSFFAIWKLIT